MTYIGIILTFLFINNFILVKFLGLCPFIGVSKNSESALGMGLSVTFVTSISSVICYCIYYGILVPLHLEFLRTMAFILVIASLVQLVEMVLKKISVSLYKALGIYLPLITTNCAVLGICFININESYNLMQSFVAGISAGAGFSIAIILMSNIREKTDLLPVRKWFKGVPIAFISAGIMALSFMAFDNSLLLNLGLK